MSYDFYSYRPRTDQPNTQEAEKIISSEEDAEFRDDAEAREFKERIASAFLSFETQLTQFEFDYTEIARSMNASEEEAKRRWNHVELNPPENGLAIQIQINWEYVSYTIRYWYTGDKAAEVFLKLRDYLKLAREEAGFFAFDPQQGRAFDPNIEGMTPNTSEYTRISENLPLIVSQGLPDNKKPWWKFW